MKKMLLGLAVVVMSSLVGAQPVISPEVRGLILGMKQQVTTLGKVDEIELAREGYSSTVAFLREFVTFDLLGVIKNNDVKFINLSSRPVYVGGIDSSGAVEVGIIEINAGGSVVLKSEKLCSSSFEKLVISYYRDFRVIVGLSNRDFNFVWINIDGDEKIIFECV